MEINLYAFFSKYNNSAGAFMRQFILRLIKLIFYKNVK